MRSKIPPASEQGQSFGLFSMIFGCCEHSRDFDFHPPSTGATNKRHSIGVEVEACQKSRSAPVGKSLRGQTVTNRKRRKRRNGGSAGIQRLLWTDGSGGSGYAAVFGIPGNFRPLRDIRGGGTNFPEAATHAVMLDQAATGIGRPSIFSIARSRSRSSRLTNDTARPRDPARPVRPIRCT